MTANQRHSLELAVDLLAERRSPADLTDSQWALLLLAADVRNPQAIPQLVAYRIMQQFEQGTGYFSPSCVATPTAPDVSFLAPSSEG